MFYATVVLLKWRHGPHHHVSREAQGVRNPGEYGRGGDTENRRGVDGKRLSNEDRRRQRPSYKQKVFGRQVEMGTKNMLFASV